MAKHKKNKGLYGSPAEHAVDADMARGRAKYFLDHADELARADLCTQAVSELMSAKWWGGIASYAGQEGGEKGFKAISGGSEARRRCIRPDSGAPASSTMHGLGEGEGGGSGLIYGVVAAMALGVLMLAGKSGVSAEDIAKGVGTQKKG